jgi:membrane-anchored protein YejM (alkaline phosphatase superfamily)
MVKTPVPFVKAMGRLHHPPRGLFIELSKLLSSKMIYIWRKAEIMRPIKEKFFTRRA